MSSRAACLYAALVLGIFIAGCKHEQPQAKSDEMIVRATESAPRDRRDALYISNREPLEPSPFVKLPIGSITPKGWLLHQLELERDGMVGHLPEISKWCNFEGNAWANRKGEGHSGWEEMPYWLKGYGDLGYVLRDQQIVQLTRRWVDSILATQREDGWFGPRGLLTSLQGKPDLWPNMIVLNVLQSWQEATGDPRIIPFMTRYFRWQLNCPEQDFMAGYWPKMRAGDNIESIYWVYNRTGEAWLLAVAAKCHKFMARWDEDVINWHGVNISQGFREPTIYWMQTHDAKHLQGAERNYQKFRGMYGQFPGGMFVADENARPGYTDPRGGAETCSLVEFMHSAEMLTKITGNAIWSDRCEDVAFNSLPASMTPELSALHYVTSANQIQLDKGNKAPGIQNSGTMFSYSPFERYRCCQHNVSHGWPYYAQELWLATSDRGLCASLYAPSEVTAKVGAGSLVTIVEETDYPFSGHIRLSIKNAADPVRFPLYLRIPGWAKKYELAVNGQQTRRPKVISPGYVVIEREWKGEDVVDLVLPMEVTIQRWPKNHNSASVDCGPLTYSLLIGERWERSGGTEKWPEWEVFPTTPWNYGLVLDGGNPGGSMKVVRRVGAIPAQPFTPENAPIRITAKARRIPNWQQDTLGLVGALQDSPAATTEKEEMITLIPMGAARLRIASFPVASAAKGAHEWAKPALPPTVSHCFESDTPAALNDGSHPTSSNDQTIERLTFWPHQGTTEWVQYNYEQPKRIAGVEVYWYNDQAKGGHCREPKGWQVMYRDGNQWKPTANASGFPVELDKFNKATFDPVETTAIRLQIQLHPQASAGILEWRVLE